LVVFETVDNDCSSWKLQLNNIERRIRNGSPLYFQGFDSLSSYFNLS
jgi:hypothetical protein